MQPEDGQPLTFLSDLVLGGPRAARATVQESEARLEAALWKLSPVYREVICLRAYCGMSDARIAHAMDLPSEETAAVLLLRARAELRSRL